MSNQDTTAKRKILTPHTFKRVTTRIGVVGAVATGGFMAGQNEWLELAAKIDPQWWVVIWMAGITFFIIKWVSNYGKQLHRSPNGEISRIREDFIRVSEANKLLDKRVDDMRERLARIEGDLSGFIPVVEGKG